MMHRKHIIKKTVHIGIAALASRFLGFVRELLLARYLGAGVIADAWQTAFLIPNTLRKIFAEGALNAALNPTLIAVSRKDKEDKAQTNGLVTAVLIVIQSILLLLCLVVSYHASFIMSLVAPGFSYNQLALSTALAKILIFFTLFTSAWFVLAAALVAAHRFFIPANSSSIINILIIAQLLVCLYYQLSITWLAYFFLIDGLIILLVHWKAYRSAGFAFVWPDAQSWVSLQQVMAKFVPSLITMGGVEISLVVDRIFASFLPVGSIALLSYTSTFLRAPLGIFISGFATILLSRMSHLGIYAPKRLSFYLLQASELVAWVIIPTSLLMIAFSHKLFYTLLLSSAFTLNDVNRAATIFIAFSAGLFFFALNKIIMNVFYALHDTMRPTYVTLLGTSINTILNILLMRCWGVTGIAVATSCSAALQTILYLKLLQYSYSITLYWAPFGRFLLRLLVQIALYGLLLYVVYGGFYYLITALPQYLSHFFLKGLGYWAWVGPLCSMVGIGMYLTRKQFGIRIYFLD